MSDAGKPVSPTIHPRTRPEATDNAVRMRGTGDWFRHDGKNVEAQPAPAHRLATDDADEIAKKNKGQPKEWFEHHPDDPAEARPVSRTSAEAKEIHDKIAGTEEKWFKMEENKDYFSPRPKDHLTGTERGREIKANMKKDKSSDWYKHEHEESTEQTEPPKQRLPTASAEQNEKRTKGSAGKPDWYSHEGGPASPDEGVGATKPKFQPVCRLTNPDAEVYLERNKHGSTSDWYTHDHAADQPVAFSPRVPSTEGQAIAGKLKGESEAWYDYSDKPASSAPKEKYMSKEARTMLDRSRGGEMKQVMDVASNGGYKSEKAPRVKPEAESVAKKNQNGLMDKYLNQEQNKGYESARPAPRIKPEATDTADKNKGVVNEVMGGYLPDPEKHSQKRVKPEAQETAMKHTGASMSKLMQGELPATPRRSGKGTSEQASYYAERNKGTLKGMMDNYGRMEISARPAPKLASSEAEAIAAKHKGSVASCFAYDGY